MLPLAYLLPNDESESDRLDMLHELCLQLLHRRLYLAPIKNPERVIDLATGTGIWAIDFGTFCFLGLADAGGIWFLTHCRGASPRD